MSNLNEVRDARRFENKYNQFYPSRLQRENWQWRIPFKTKAVTVPDPLDRDALFANLDQCQQEVWAFEVDLKEKTLRCFRRLKLSNN